MVTIGLDLDLDQNELFKNAIKYYKQALEDMKKYDNTIDSITLKNLKLELANLVCLTPPILNYQETETRNYLINRIIELIRIESMFKKTP